MHAHTHTRKQPPPNAPPDPHPGNLLASPDGTLVYLDFGMMSEAPQYARFAIISHVVHLVNRWARHGFI
jgi:predicted unusual protein kinase regulating ubiquinone biosynthesis (AarF/ABC1/UbiB family)